MILPMHMRMATWLFALRWSYRIIHLPSTWSSRKLRLWRRVMLYKFHQWEWSRRCRRYTGHLLFEASNPDTPCTLCHCPSCTYTACSCHLAIAHDQGCIPDVPRDGKREVTVCNSTEGRASCCASSADFAAKIEVAYAYWCYTYYRHIYIYIYMYNHLV